ncbi:MAG TPA: DUF4388 domain-containing protein [Ktedonobacterales bacterium]|nr:DUF4388 domain-containing protein [Ktedonobacterales bacterium]
MTKPRVTTADRLSNIIEVVELGRRSGLLTVERGSQQALEQGEVYFSQGRAMYAVVEGLRGPDALATLASWGECRFAFEPNAPRPRPNITGPMASPTSPSTTGMGGGTRSGAYPPPPSRPQRSQPTPPRGAPASFNWSAPGNRPLPDPLTPTNYPTGAASQPRGMPAGGAGTGPITPSAPSAPSSSSSYGASWPSEWPNNQPNSGRAPTGQLNWPTQTSALPSVPSPGSTPSQSTGPFAGGPSGDSSNGSLLRPEVTERRPRRSPDVRDLISVVSAHNLSRNHRTILLLADGEHTVLDLARLSSKPIDEIVALLADLERVGLVY